MNYIGSRGRDGRCSVRIHDATTDTDYGPLPPRLDLRDLGSDEFEWGYQGGGPSLLALSLLAQHLGDDARAIDLLPDFRTVVARLPHESWTLTTERIDAEITAIETTRRGDIPF